MITQIKKRNGEIVNFNKQKIAIAITKANNETNEDGMEVAVNDLVIKVVERLEDETGVVTVECIQDIVEDILLDSDYKDTARSYILYRERQKQKKKRDIFSKRLEMKPFEYPELYQYVDAIRHSYWLHTEFNYTSDIQDYLDNAEPHEKEAVTRSMLAIAQVEVAVKTFWGDLYHRMPKYEIGAVGASFSESECYREGTEILTPKGWVDFRDVENGDLVAQFNHDNTIDFVPARNKIVKDFDGKLHHIHNSRGINTWVTPNHNMVLFNNKDTKRFNLIPSSKYDGKNKRVFIPQSAKKKNGTISELSDSEKLAIAIHADGSKTETEQHYVYSFHLKKERKITRLLDILHSLGLDYSKYNSKNFRVSFKLPKKYDYKKFDWVDIEDKTYMWAREFINEVTLWDGCIPKERRSSMYNTSCEDSADLVQMVATLAGFRAKKSKYVQDNKKDMFRVIFVDGKDRVPALYKIEEVEYKGNVYCVEVNSGAIITRYDGVPTIAGNCRHADSYSHLLEILGLNNEFDKIKEIPALKKRVDYLSNMVQFAKSQDDREYILSMILFSLFTEHVSLFSQFLIMMSFNKHKNMFKGLSNVIEATSKEEQIHGLFGIDVVNIVREEHPEWFDKDMEEAVYKACRDAYESEEQVIEWILGEGELDFMHSDVVKEFVKQRLNNSLESTGFEPIFEVNKELVDQTTWFDDEVIGTKLTDFLHKRSVNYTKFSQSINGDTIFSPMSDLQTKGKNEVNQTIRLRMLDN